MRPAWGQERHQMPYPKVPRAGGAGRVLSSTPRSGRPGFLSVTGCVRARLERKESEPAGVRRVDAPAAARRRPWGAGLLYPHPTEPWRFQVKISQATAPVSRASQAGTGLLQAPTTRAVGPGAQSGWRWGGDRPPSSAGWRWGAVTGPRERRGGARRSSLRGPCGADRGGGAAPGPAPPWLRLRVRAWPFQPGVQSSGWPRRSREPSALGAAVPLLLPPPASPERARSHGTRGGAGRLSPGTR